MRYWLISAVFLLHSIVAHAGGASVTFDGDVYEKAWATTQEGAELVEYLRDGESLESWTQMISIQKHANAKTVADVLSPHLSARKQLLALEPEFFGKSDSVHAEDAIAAMVLVAPDRSFIEYAMVRAVADAGQPVWLVTFSKRFPYAQTFDFGPVEAKRNDWMTALFDFPVGSSGAAERDE